MSKSIEIILDKINSNKKEIKILEEAIQIDILSHNSKTRLFPNDISNPFAEATRKLIAELISQYKTENDKLYSDIKILENHKNQ